MNTILEKVKSYINESFKNESVIHFERTLFWVKKLQPTADDALIIAAYSHDIERAFRTDNVFRKIKTSKEGFTDVDFLKNHQEKGAEIMYDFLISNKADKQLAKRVAHLIRKHEVGGDEDQNLLKDADSISFFETNAPFFADVKVKDLGTEKVKAKFDWMFERITSPKAKKFAEPIYKAMLQMLEL